jgi:cytochrome c553
MDELLALLKTGDTRDGDHVGGNMGKVVANTRELSDADRAAMATYIKSLPPVEGPKKPESK